MRVAPRCASFPLFLIPFVMIAGPAIASEIVVFGDSWGVPAAPSLQTVLANNGHVETVAGAAVGGETAANLSSPSGLTHITNTLAANPDVQFVHLSIGGNDFLGQWNSSFTPAQQAALFQAVANDVETIVDHILAQAPGVLILWSSYDYPRPLPLGTPTEVNAASAAFQSYAQTLADSKGASLTAMDFSGLMQVTYGFDGVQYTIYDPPFVIVPGDPSLPDPTLPGPEAAYFDSIHLTAAGYLVFAEEQYAQFYSAHLGPPAVPVLSLAARALLAAGVALIGAGWMPRRR